MAPKRERQLDPLRPRFPRAAIVEVTTIKGATAVAQLQHSAKQNGLDTGLVHEAAIVAMEFFAKVKPPDMGNTYPVEVAAAVAHLGLDKATPTKAESVVAALFEQTIARKPYAVSEIKHSLEARLRSDRSLSPEREEAIDAALGLAEQVAKFSRVPRLYAANPSLPDQVFSDAQEMALAMPNPRVAVIKTVEAMNRLRSLDRVRERDPQEAGAILMLAEKLYLPLTQAMGWKAATSTIEDKIFAARDPDGRKNVIRIVEEKMGEGFFDQERQIVAAGARFIQRIVETELNRDADGSNPISVRVGGRIKSPSSIAAKIRRKGGLEHITDLLAFRIVTPDENKEACYKALAALQQVFVGSNKDYHDYVADPDKPYDSIHLVATAVERQKHRSGGRIPPELVGKLVEIQIRDQRMDREAELGVASHLGYKSHGVVMAGNRFLTKVLTQANIGVDASDHSAMRVLGRMPRSKNEVSSLGTPTIPEFMVVLPGSSALQRTNLLSALGKIFVRPQRDGNSNVIGQVNKASETLSGVTLPEELKHMTIRIGVTDNIPEAAYAAQGWNARTELTVTPYLERTAALRHNLSQIIGGTNIWEVQVPGDVFAVSGDGTPLRLPRGASLMDALVTANPANVRAYVVRHNDTEVSLNASARRIRIQNGDMVVPVGMSDQPPDPVWLQRGVLKTPAARAAVEAARNAGLTAPMQG